MADDAPVANPIDVLESSEDEQDSHQAKDGKCTAARIPSAANATVVLTKPGKNFKRPRRLTSTVWTYFEFLDTPDAQGNILCKCKRCGQTYNAESKQGTGNLSRHIKKCLKSTYKDVGQMIIDSSSSGSLLNRRPVIDQDVFREMLAYAIVKHDLPFQFAEYDGIRRCFSYLNHDVKFFSRNTIKNDIMKMFEREKKKLKEELSVVRGRISITSDCWTSITTDGYISLTAHYVDNNWCLQKRILNFHFMPPPHTGMHMAEHVRDMLQEWGIHQKIMSVTLDNASANDLFVDNLKPELALVCYGKFFHVRCCAHILNLVVQDGLKEIDEAVIKVRDTVKYCKGSQARKERFLSSVAKVELDCARGLRQDVPTRWNSTYLMLESVLYYKKAFNHLQRNDKNYTHCPTVEEWVRIEKIFKFLKVFFEVTKVFSGTLYPTANMYFPNVLKVRLLLKSEIDSPDKFMQKMATKMFEKFSKYWSEFSVIMAVAVLLDPRFKYQFIEWAFKKVYGEYEGGIELIKFKEMLEDLYGCYVAENSATSSTSRLHKHNSSTAIPADCVEQELASDAYMTDFDSFSAVQSTVATKSDLEMYMEEPLIPRTTNIDILYHWKTNEVRYPILSLMARDILSIPISTVASESAFSTGGRVLDCYRSSMKPATAEAVICLNDWTFGEAKINPQMEDLCGKIMTLKVGDNNPSPPESAPQSPATPTVGMCSSQA